MNSLTLPRWPAGERISPLPIPAASAPPPALSFELFPPKTEALEAQFWTRIRRLAPLSPRFASVNRPDLTYAIAHILGVRPKTSAPCLNV
ncbi:methylenetetrahydrofolate reductase [Acidocella sp. KAb 2-4]|uniref:methylenetetrahydrofolate reductase n=1 Tax=Acidocella sp. KAb 2-4 TaxID=2885158 RepID=UPI001D08F6A8|nr:methylenetetrahydrofolate reductase [Acidocella sp. KAb 2-4]MCB5946036.1 methylenetetrahydrofolate reductase [Acidocella sp. KAb 2-4]